MNISEAGGYDWRGVSRKSDFLELLAFLIRVVEPESR